MRHCRSHNNVIKQAVFFYKKSKKRNAVSNQKFSIISEILKGYISSSVLVALKLHKLNEYTLTNH